MEKMTTIICGNCELEVQKPAREIKRQQKKGRTKFYCSVRCSKLDTEQTHLKDWAQSEENKEHLKRVGRKSDEYTGLREHMRRASKRDKETDIDLKYLKELWEGQDGRCAYTNVKLVHPDSHKTNRNYNYVASLDRIDSKEGYVKGNVQFISVTCNWLKNDCDSEHVMEFFQIIGDVLDSTMLKQGNRTIREGKSRKTAT